MRIMNSHIHGTNEIALHKEFAIKNIQETPIWIPPAGHGYITGFDKSCCQASSLNIAKCNPSFLTAI